MGLNGCISVGMIVAGVCGAGAWFIGPFAELLAAAAAFGLGALLAMIWLSQGKT